MGLQDAFNKATKDWNAKTDSTNQSDLIPVGTYQVMLDKVDHPVYKSGWDCLRFSMQVIKGKYASRKEQLRISLATKTKTGKPIQDWIVSRNIRTISKIGAMVGLNVTPELFPDNETDAYEKLVAAFKPYEGKTLEMTITFTRNKKDPDNPYRNYDFGPGIKVEEPAAKEEPVTDKEPEPTVDDDDLPF